MRSFPVDSEARHWPVLLASFVASSLTHGIASSIGVFYIEWHNEFVDSSALVGWLSSSLLAMLLGFSPFAGALVKYFKVFWVIVAGALLSFTGLLIASLAEEFIVLFITIPFMAGIGFGMAYVGHIVTISECFHKHYALANGIAMTGASVGMVLLPILFRFLIDQYSWRKALMIVAAVQANVLVCAGVVRGVSRKQSRRRVRDIDKDDSPANSMRMNSDGTDHAQGHGNFSQMSDDEDGFEGDAHSNSDGRDGTRQDAIVHSNFEYESVAAGDPQDIREDRSAQKDSCLSPVVTFLDHSGMSLLWTNRVFASFMVTALFVASIYGITLSYLAARAKSVEISDLKATLLISVIGISNIVTRLTHGRLLDANVIQPAYIYCFFVALPTIAGPIIAVTESYPGLVTCTALIGLAAGAYIPMQAVLVYKIAGKERFPGAFGIGLVTVAIGNMSSAALGGYMFDVTGSYSLGFHFVGVMSGVTTVLMLGIHLLWTRLVPDDRWPRINPAAREVKHNSNVIELSSV